MRQFLVSYQLMTRRGDTGFGDAVINYDGPLSAQAVEDFRAMVKGGPRTPAGASVVLLNIVPLEDETPATPQTIDQSNGEAALRQRLTDLIAMWRKDTGQYTRTGRSLAASDLERVLKSETGQ